MITYQKALQELYVAYFGRPADVDGLDYWNKVVTTENGSTAAVSAAFAGSAEYKAEYANMNAAAVVGRIYQNLFGRPAEDAGLSYWSTLLADGKLSIDLIVKNIAEGAQGTDQKAFSNKVKAASAFTSELDTPEEILGYNGAPANEAAKMFIRSITTDASLDAALQSDSMKRAIHQVLVGSTGAVLTTGLDNVTTSALNDTIFSWLAGTANTLQVNDRIDGGAGRDLLQAVLSNVPGELIFPVSTNVEMVALTARAVSAAPVPLIYVHATKMLGVELWQSHASDYSMEINSVALGASQVTKDVTIAMSESAAGDHDLRVLFGQTGLRAATGKPITASIIVDDVGMGGTSGDLMVGGVLQTGSEVVDGIERFEIEVRDNSKLQTISSSNERLREIIFRNGATSSHKAADLGKYVDKGDLTVLGSGTGWGFMDVRVLDASAMTGRIHFDALITSYSFNKYILQRGANALTNQVEFLYSGGANDDTIDVAIDAGILASRANLVTDRADFALSINGGAGNDLITVFVGAPGPAFAGVQALNANLNIRAGDGDDVVFKPGVGNAIIALDGGNDTVYLDNGGIRAAWIFDVATHVDAGAGARLVVTYKGVQASVAVPATGAVNINQLIKSAINNDKVLNKLIVAAEVQVGALEVTALIDGVQAIGELTVTMGANSYPAQLTVAGTNSKSASDNTVSGGLGDDILVLGSSAGIDAELSDNDTVVFSGAFGNDLILHFTGRAGVGADRLDFSALGGRSAGFTGDTVSNANGAIMVVPESVDNDSVADIKALFGTSSTSGKQVYVAYNTANIGNVYAVAETVNDLGRSLTVELVGSIDLADTAWSSIAASNFV